MTDTATTAAVDDPKELGGIVARWDEELRAYEKAAKNWVKDGKRIIKRYALKDRKNETDSDTRFNILWSNVQTRKPAVFSRVPVPVVERRFRDKDVVGRVASQMLERAVSTDLEFDEIDVAAEQIVEDVELVGRGIPWVRYEADFVTTETAVAPLEEGGFVDPDGNTLEDADEQEDGSFMVSSEDVASERAPVEYVYWEDFFHKPVKNWKELERDGWVARRVFMTRRQGIDRFGEIFKEVPLTASPKGMEEKITEDMAPLVKLAEVFEIWNAADKEAIWIAREFKQRPLDRKPDPLKLEKFFPCPRAAFATLTNDSLIPVPDYLQYEPLADELDKITERITVLTKALKVSGVYDGGMEGLAKLLDSDADNVMIPVTNFAALMGKGSTGSTIKNVVQFLPLDLIIQTLLGLYDSRDRTKATLFEISGISDILRGDVDPREKLGQSKIKGQFATLRLDRRQKEIARVLRDVIRLKAEIIAEQFDDRVLREISGFDQLPEIVQMAQTLDEQGQPVGQFMVDRMFAQTVQLIRDDKARGFRIDIETDSTVSIDEQETKEARVEFLTAAGGFLQQALPIAQEAPDMRPLLGEMLLFAVRGFKAGRPLEAAFEDMVEELNQPQQAEQQPDPEMLKLQAEQQLAEGRLALEREKAQGELALKREVANAETQIKLASAAGPENREKLQIEAQKAAADIGLKREVAAAEMDLKNRELEAEMALKERSESVLSQSTTSLAQTADALATAAQSLSQAVATIAQSAEVISKAAEDISSPKEIMRDESGRAVGVRSARKAA